MTSFTIPKISTQIRPGNLDANIKFVTPLKVQPMHPMGPFRSHAMAAPPPPGGWDYRLPKAHSTPAPSVTGKDIDEATLTLCGLDNDSDDAKVEELLKTASRDKDLPPAKKQCTSGSNPAAHTSKHTKLDKWKKA